MTRKEYTAENLKVVFDEIAHDDGTINRQQFMHAIAQLEESEMSKLSRSLSRNELSRSGSRGNVQVGLARANSRAVPLLFEDAPTLDDTVVVDDETHDKIETTKTLSEILPSRISTTMEVGVSKICKSTVQRKQDVASRLPSFPLSPLFCILFSVPVMAGFGWQGASVLADMYGFAADTSAFALVTGAGDFTGVCLGHTGWMVAKRLINKDDSIDVTAELHTGVLLGTAAFFSGTTWQPLVNLLHDTLHLGKK